MGKLPMCRICLVKDVRMFNLVNTSFQETYESLTAIEFQANDLRPSQVCYICYARLQTCQKLRTNCLQSEKLFTEMMVNNTIEPPPLHNSTGPLTIHLVTHLSVPLQDSDARYNIGVEDPNAADALRLVGVQVKVEDVEDVPMPKKVQPDEQNWIVAKKVQLDKQEKYSDVKSSKLNTFVRFEASNEILMITSKNSKKERKPYICDICKRGFHEKSDLLKHTRAHKAVRRYKCDKCEKCFEAKCHLEKHKRTHTGEKPYECDICEKKFCSISNRNSHRRIHTGEKRYKCDICKRSFNIKDGLLNHIRTHTGEKPYKCNICEKSFTFKGTLVRHMRVHTGEKPYKCDICGKQFSQKYPLTNHMRMHTGEKPYHCNFCHKSYTQNCNFKKHLRTHTSEKQ